ncbi:MAG: rhomboid family intramembrane serine protease [Gemmatimonadota bacterium]
MGLADRSYTQAYAGGGPGGYALTPWVRRLLVANGAIYLLMAVGFLPPRWAIETFGFSPATVLRHPWSPLTYMFIHGGFLHVFFNMIGVFFLGPPLERAWGSREFIRFYLVSGLGAALFSFLLIGLVGTPLVIGASGALFGLLLAFALKWPNVPIYIWGILPIRAKWFVTILGLLSFLEMARGSGGNVAHWTHLGGLLAGFLYLRWGDRAAALVGRVPWRRRRRVEVVRPVGARRGSPSRFGGGTRRRPVDRDSLDEVDRILDKIRAEGIEALSDEERTFLDEMSRRYRGAT